ncbi:putative protein phosphatase 2C 8 [Tetrabaena socialis]|uniref:PPM-type phosphatase domain-containing protein n=1 Tax=Tetrabaena socialis TaxID=47790 RepID=A0A2J8A1I3_9CHLO|nr:putative protein phosphatase 2C 8 [Tetrabaena socialis]|eukprot:PNH06386.1 putative protein phosphatase 2C 8 [Tetrabaena socialis]
MASIRLEKLAKEIEAEPALRMPKDGLKKCTQLTGALKKSYIVPKLKAPDVVKRSCLTILLSVLFHPDPPGYRAIEIISDCLQVICEFDMPWSTINIVLRTSVLVKLAGVLTGPVVHAGAHQRLYDNVLLMLNIIFRRILQLCDLDLVRMAYFRRVLDTHILDIVTMQDNAHTHLSIMMLHTVFKDLEGIENENEDVNQCVSRCIEAAFRETDSGLHTGDTTGSTAVMALVGDAAIWIANCGDSRAVLSRAGGVLQLSQDHRPMRADEYDRVKQAGGVILSMRNGSMYVMGQLAVTRSFGDFQLRPYVIAQPEIIMHSRTEEDEFLILASDGLWDTLDNKEAVDIVHRCLRHKRVQSLDKREALVKVGRVLTKFAVSRGSRDNVTAIIINLKDE